MRHCRGSCSSRALPGVLHFQVRGEALQGVLQFQVQDEVMQEVLHFQVWGEALQGVLHFQVRDRPYKCPKLYTTMISGENN